MCFRHFELALVLSSTDLGKLEIEFNLEWRTKPVSHCHTYDSWSCVCKDPQERKTEVGLGDEFHQPPEKLRRKACRLSRETVAANVLCTCCCNFCLKIQTFV